MFIRLIQADWIKFRSSWIWLPALTGPAMAALTGVDHILRQGTNGGMPPNWQQVYLSLVQFYALLLYPLISGTFSSLLCRIEHLTGGWKALHSLPVARSHIYLSKLVYLFGLLAATQLLFFAGVWELGAMLHVRQPIPWQMFGSYLAAGWLAMLPVSALQLWASTVWRNFGLPFAVNVIFTIPSIAVHKSVYGLYYPWCQPFYAMIGNHIQDTARMFLIIGGALILFITGGWAYFIKRDVTL